MKPIFDDGFRSNLVEGAEFDGAFDIPVIHALPDSVPFPTGLLPFEKRRQVNDVQRVIHFYMQDYRFNQIITSTERYVDELRQFQGVISPDRSLYRNMPFALQLVNTYLNRAVGHYLQREGLTVWPNVRWGDERSFAFCFDGLPKKSILAVSTHGALKGNENRYYFVLGLDEMMVRLEPKRLIVHGHMPESIFGPYNQSVEIKQYPSRIVEMREGGE